MTKTRKSSAVYSTFVKANFFGLKLIITYVICICDFQFVELN